MPETEEGQARVVLERARVELGRAPLVDDIRVRISSGICELARAGDAAIDAKDPSTREHSERVAALAARLARLRGWSAERVAQLHEAALVHDVGKIGVTAEAVAALEADPLHPMTLV